MIQKTGTADPGQAQRPQEERDRSFEGQGIGTGAAWPKTTSQDNLEQAIQGMDDEKTDDELDIRIPKNWQIRTSMEHTWWYFCHN